MNKEISVLCDRLDMRHCERHFIADFMESQLQIALELPANDRGTYYMWCSELYRTSYFAFEAFNRLSSEQMSAKWLKLASENNTVKRSSELAAEAFVKSLSIPPNRFGSNIPTSISMRDDRSLAYGEFRGMDFHDGI